MSGWWDRASVAQRLAQIDGGIECGLTIREVAICSGFRLDDPIGVSRVANTAHPHGRRFGDANRGRSGRKAKRVGDLKRAYFGGVERDFNDAPAISARVVDDDFDEAA